MTIRQDFCVVILSHGRPDRVFTYETLKRQGYTGPIIILIDDTDKTREQYENNFGKSNVVVFDKQLQASKTDQGDNFNNLRTTTHVRNRSFEEMRRLNYKFFVQLDDDYTSFDWRFDKNLKYEHRKIKSKCLNEIFNAFVSFLEKNKQVTSIAMAQGGDFIGGELSGMCFGAGKVGMKRKAMNSFFCSTDKEFKFVGRLNEDVNTYTSHGMRGKVFFTLNQIGLEQLPTQSNSGGMTEAYLDSGTYVKSFYTVMFCPSAVSIRTMGVSSRRIHHYINWSATAPKILRESFKK